MRTESVLLDTSFIIDFLRGRPEAKSVWDAMGRDGVIFCCCAINVEEGFAGMKPGEEDDTLAFVRALRYYPISRAAARRAGTYRREYRLRGITLHTPDTLIAGVCSIHGLALVTRNLDHFPMKDFPVMGY